MHALVLKLTTEHLQQMTSCRERLADTGQICGAGRRTAGYRKLREEMWLGSILASQMEFALQVLLSDLQIAESHADVFVTEQLHECGQADAEAEHF